MVLKRSVSGSDIFQTGVDLCYVKSRLVDRASCIPLRYDAGICKHQLEHTGVLLSQQCQKLDDFTEIACTLMARDYKGIGN